jgi:hypothetical protein
MTPFGIEPATFRFVAQRLNHCATAVPNLKEAKKKNEIIFETSVGLFCEEMKAELEEGGGRILLGHKTSGGTIMPQTIRCPRVGLLISS